MNRFNSSFALCHLGRCVVMRSTKRSLCFLSIKCNSSWTTTYSMQGHRLLHQFQVEQDPARLFSTPYSCGFSSHYLIIGSGSSVSNAGDATYSFLKLIDPGTFVISGLTGYRTVVARIAELLFVLTADPVSLLRVVEGLLLANDCRLPLRFAP